MEKIINWFRRQLDNPQVVILSVFLIIGFSLIIFAGKIIAPLIAGLVIAYVLEGGVKFTEGLRLPRLAAVLIVLMLFLIFVFALMFGVLPLISAQAVQLVSQIPGWMSQGQEALLQLPSKYPDVVSEDQVSQLIEVINIMVTELGQKIIALSAASVVGIITLVIYLVLVPILVFFFLKDKSRLTTWFAELSPGRDRGLTKTVWENVNRQMSNYIRGKFWEIIIVGIASTVTFTLFGLQYSILLGTVVGLSVLIPYVGAAVVTIPVVTVALFQWGLSAEFAWLVLAYFVIQILDGNVLVPLIFSEVVNLHPVAIVAAVLFFGGIWGIWGIFFAIPLATLVQAVLSSWPKGTAEDAS